jgi:hypothetical protein
MARTKKHYTDEFKTTLVGVCVVTEQKITTNAHLIPNEHL